MVLRHRIKPPRDLFPTDPWAIEARGYTSEYLRESETIFALGNGYLGLRGSHEEDLPVGEPGTYINGFHELRDIVYGEEAYGFPKTGQTMLNCPDGKIMKLYVDDEPFDVESRELASYRRRLDLRQATLERELVWLSPNGTRIHLKTTRLVSLSHRHLAAIQYEVTVENGDADIVVSSEMVNRQPVSGVTGDPRLAQSFDDEVLDLEGQERDGLRAVFSFATGRSGMMLGCGMDHAIETECAHEIEDQWGAGSAAFVFKVRAEQGEPIRIVKYLAYHHSSHRSFEELIAQAGWTLDHATELGFHGILERQRQTAGAFWESSDVELEATEQHQQAVRWNLFQLMQASYCVEGTGIPARGLTGQSYEGHYFWDTEIYVLPFLLYTNPRVARSLLKFRYDKLDRARKRAVELGHKGALFPWRTINGDEASAYYAASTAQYHINADIAYAIRKYVKVTGDIDFLHKYGAEILVETARLWADLGYYNTRLGGKFCIAGVTGPDEYTAVVNNNYFTNIMAQTNLRYAAEVMRDLERDHPKAFTSVVRKTDVEDHEVAEWEKAADAMFLPSDGEMGIHPQDDSFLEKEVWDFENTPENHYPLLLHYHPLNLYRFQVIKQADTLLAMFLQGHRFTHEDKKRNFDYYDPLTTHDSSLSVCIQSIIANEVGYTDKALAYFDFSAMMDLSDVGGNVTHGAHIASIGGSWMSLIYGFGGLRDYLGNISFEPKLPPSWRRLAFKLRIRGAQLQVEMTPDETTYTLVDGEGIEFRHCGEEIRLTSEAPGANRSNVATESLAERQQHRSAG